MTSFRFPLERLRALRERGEDLAKQELAGALHRQARCAERLRAMGEEVAEAFATQRAAAAGGSSSAADLLAAQAYLERMEQASSTSTATTPRSARAATRCARPPVSARRSSASRSVAAPTTSAPSRARRVPCSTRSP